MVLLHVLTYIQSNLDNSKIKGPLQNFELSKSILLLYRKIKNHNKNCEKNMFNDFKLIDYSFVKYLDISDCFKELT